VLRALYPDSIAACTITDATGQPVLGLEVALGAAREMVSVEGTVLGWVSGPQATGVAALLTLLGNKELELKSLGAEVLDRYREINLFYNLSEKLSGLLEPAELADVILKEATRLIQAEAGFVAALDAGPTLEVLANVSGALDPDQPLILGQGIIGSLAEQGKAEIIGDLPEAGRRFEGNPRWQAMLSCPLKSNQRVIGVMGLLSSTPNVYTAGDLKLLNTLATQAAFQIDTTIVYRRTIREAAERAAQLERQLESLLNFDIDQSQAEHDVEEIAKTEFFQQLIARRGQRTMGD
jgi:GAF domain-containing protein